MEESTQFMTPASILTYEMAAYYAVNSPPLRCYNACFVEAREVEDEAATGVELDSDGCYNFLIDAACESSVMTAFY